jgi:RES domain-containing protein
MTVYRITHAAHAHQLIASGNPARWNSRDVKVIYTSQSLSLACLENIVHRRAHGLDANFKALHIEIPDSLYISFLSLKKLPAGWQQFDSMRATQKIGNEWVRANQSCILQVPSVIIPDDYNFILNVNHPDFHLIKIKKSEPFNFDKRLR